MLTRRCMERDTDEDEFEGEEEDDDDDELREKAIDELGDESRFLAK